MSTEPDDVRESATEEAPSSHRDKSSPKVDASAQAKKSIDAEPIALRVAAIVGAAVVVLSAALVLTFDYGRDQAIYALVAREMLGGKLPYRDAFDFKPPGIFFVYALTRFWFGSAQSAIRVVEVLSMLTTAWGLVRLSEAYTGRRTVGFIAAGLASQVHAQLDFWHTAQPETFGGTMTVWGLVTATRAWRATDSRRRALLWVATGVLFGAGGLMKPPLAGAGALIALIASAWSAWSDRTAQRPLRKLDALVPTAATAVGGVLPIAITLAWFKAKGGLADLHEVLFVFTPYYTKISWENASVLSMGFYGISEWLVTYSSALLGGLVALAVLRPEARLLKAALVLLGCIFVHIAGIVMQGKFFPYHWGATFPLTALLAALGYERLLSVLARRFSWGGVLVFVAGFSIIAAARCPVPSYGETFVARSRLRWELVRNRPADQQAHWDGLATVADVDAGQNRAVATWLRENTPSNQPIFVWGFECVIYDLAQRPIASRYIYNVPQRAMWSAEPMQKALMAELERNPPSAIVVEHWDIFGMVTGNNDDSARALWSFDALRAMLYERYSYRTTIGDFDIYVKREPEPGEDDGFLDGTLDDEPVGPGSPGQ